MSEVLVIISAMTVGLALGVLARVEHNPAHTTYEIVMASSALIIAAALLMTALNPEISPNAPGYFAAVVARGTLCLLMLYVLIHNPARGGPQ